MTAGPAAAPIGVYDSGVGGIAVLRALRAALPDEDFVYMADSGHAPYGDRDGEFLVTRAHAVAAFFARRNAKALVLACNTVSVAAAASLRAAWPLPIVAMEPAIKPAAQATRSGVVLVLATAYTVGSASVARLCERFGGDSSGGVRILLQACPGLVEQVEQGRFDAPETLALVDAYVRPGVAAGADRLVLGCTHYAFLAPQIAAAAGPGVVIVEPSQAIARELARRLAGRRAPPRAVPRPASFHTSGRVEALQAFLARIGEPAGPVEPFAD
jgi:glutamate racemase